jgi:uncharacterized repeat protein (TIGR03803 family)
MNGKNAAEPRKERTKTMKIDRKRMQWECVITLLTALLMSPNHAAAKSPVFTTIYDFTGGTGDGAGPGGVVVGSGGVLYGATAGGGAENAGTVYSLTPPVGSSDNWTANALYSFPTQNDNLVPNPSLFVVGAGGILYGTTYVGGANQVGSVFSLTPPSVSGGDWTFSDIYDFTDGSDGGDSESRIPISRTGVSKSRVMVR